MSKTTLMRPKAEVEKRFEVQIQRGEEIKRSKITNRETLDSAESALERWIGVNIQMCHQLFSDDSFSNEISTRGRMITPLDTYENHLKTFYTLADIELNSLRSMRDQVEFIPETAPQKSTKSLLASGSDSSFRKRIEDNVVLYLFGTAIFTCGITAGVMLWVQNNRVEAITTQYNTEKARTGSDYDAQIRNLNARIALLESQKTAPQPTPELPKPK